MTEKIMNDGLTPDERAHLAAGIEEPVDKIYYAQETDSVFEFHFAFFSADGTKVTFVAEVTNEGQTAGVAKQTAIDLASAKKAEWLENLASPPVTQAPIKVLNMTGEVSL